MTYFFFQAEDGIRDTSVTGVQTCALPIWQVQRRASMPGFRRGRVPLEMVRQHFADRVEQEFQIGRASCRERGEISEVAGSLKKKSRCGDDYGNLVHQVYSDGI